MVLTSAALVLAWQAASAPIAETAAPPPTAPITASAPRRRPVWIPASLAVLHGGAMAFWVATKTIAGRCEGDVCDDRRALNGASEFVPLVTVAALGTGTGLLGAGDARRDRKANLWGFRIAGAVLCGAGAVLGGAGLSSVAETEFSVIELRFVGRTLWTAGLPLLTYAFGYRRAALARMEVAPVMDPQRIGVVLSGRF